MLQVSNLKLIYDKDYRTLIDGLTFAVNPGDKIVIIGEEGQAASFVADAVRGGYFDPG